MRVFLLFPSFQRFTKAIIPPQAKFTNPSHPSHASKIHTTPRTTLLLLQHLGERRAGGALRLAGVQTLGADLLLRVASGVGVQAEQDLLVDERVLLLHAGALGAGRALGRADHALDLGAVNQSADVGLLDEGGGQEEVLLERGWDGGAAVDVVEGGECGRGPDHESAEVTTGSELQEVEREDGRCLDTSQVAERAHDLSAVDLGVVHNQGAAALAVAAATQLTLTSAELARVLNLIEVWRGAHRLQEAGCGSGARDGGAGEHLGVDDQGNLGDVGDLVATGQEESGDGRGGKGRDGSEAPGG